MARTGFPTSILVLLLAAWLGGCASAPESAVPEAGDEVCAEGDRRPGCADENPDCLNAHDYLCDFPD